MVTFFCQVTVVSTQIILDDCFVSVQSIDNSLGIGFSCRCEDIDLIVLGKLL